MKRFSLAIATIALTLAGCSKQPGSEYLGKWEREQTSRQTELDGTTKVIGVIKDDLTIDRNGEGFILRSVRVSTQGKDKPVAYPPRNEPAVFKDGQLQVAGGLASFTIDKASGHLIPPDSGGEYTRVK